MTVDVKLGGTGGAKATVPHTDVRPLPVESEGQGEGGGEVRLRLRQGERVQIQQDGEWRPAEITKVKDATVYLVGMSPPAV